MSEAQIEQMTLERRELAQRLRFFDSNVWLGRPEGFPLAEELAPHALKDALASRCVVGGLVSHWRGKTASAQDGNEAVVRALEGPGEELLAVWTGLPLYPHEAGPLPGSAELPSIVRAVRVFPKSHNFPFTRWCVGSLCEWLASGDTPLLVWHTEIEWDQLYRLAQAFPSLPIVVETQTQKILYHTRPLFALMRDCANVHVELSNFAGAGFIEDAVREFGSERLLYGSFLPVNDPLVAIGMVLDAQISESAKTLIAGDNLRRLVRAA